MGSIKIYIMINIGDLSNGGIVFYVDASGEHGLVASTKNQSNAAPWGCLGGLIDGTHAGVATYPDDAIGSNNTTLIISRCTDANIAAKLCKGYSEGGYNDWFLPSKDELNLMYQNIKGSLTPNYYWTSFEASAKSAWMQHFQTGTQCKIFKNINAHIRAIRAF